MPDVALIDLRRAFGTQRHAIPGSLHVPYPGFGEVNISDGGMLSELAKSTGKRLLFYCAWRALSHGCRRRRMPDFLLAI
jgi:hypothetical protein